MKIKTFIPDYYNKFSCIANRCKHNCCIGWEIDIDDETHEYYKSLNAAMGDRLSEEIVSDTTPHFRLSENERCPFLNNNNLCDIITELGENALCEICSEHPRFKNFYDTRTEIGLGLCCEEAGRIILNYTDKVKLIEVNDDGVDTESDEELLVFGLRDEIFDIIQNRELVFNERIYQIIEKYKLDLKDKSIAQWADFYLLLERLDEKWTELLNELKRTDVSDTELKGYDTVFEQLFVYFIYRHFMDGMYDDSLRERIGFAIIGVCMIHALCVAHYKRCGSIEIDDIIEIARLYSSEVEYCEENIENILEELRGF